MMENNKEIMPLSSEFDFSEVPGWYALCFNVTLTEKGCHFLES